MSTRTLFRTSIGVRVTAVALSSRPWATSFRRTRLFAAGADDNSPSTFPSISETPSKHGNNDDKNKRLFPEDLNIIYDSQCNVCQFEIAFLQRRDRRVNADRPRLRFTDLEGQDAATGEYQPQDPANGGVSYATGMASMHGVTAQGQVVQGVAVFRRAYQAVGLGWLWAATSWPVVSWVVDRLYHIFARYRTLLTRGVTTHQLVEAYEARRGQGGPSCNTGRCAVTKSS